LGKLGRGAFARVYEAREANEVPGGLPAKPLAAKVTDLRRRGKDGHADNEVDSRLKRALQKEVLVLKKLGSQRYTVDFVEFFIEDTMSYIVMERCDQTLLQALERRPDLTERSLAPIVRMMLMALHAVHSLDVVHRDIKPDNFLCQEETVKLCDFGMSDIIARGAMDCQGIHGTPPFMSPEMLLGAGYGTPTDVWGIGVVVYVLLFGLFPYMPAESSPKAMKAAIVAGVPEPSYQDQTSNSKASSDARQFVRALLNRDPMQRLDAGQALACQWIISEASTCDRSSSLRLALYSAKRIGAFDTRNLVDDRTSMDHQLRSLQERHHGLVLPPAVGGVPASPGRSSSKHSSRRGGSGGLGEEKHSRMAVPHTSTQSTGTGSFMRSD
jgi:serine/threonine protein kinase